MARDSLNPGCPTGKLKNHKGCTKSTADFKHASPPSNTNRNSYFILGKQWLFLWLSFGVHVNKTVFQAKYINKYKLTEKHVFKCWVLFLGHQIPTYQPKVTLSKDTGNPKIDLGIKCSNQLCSISYLKIFKLISLSCLSYKCLNNV